MDTPESDQTIDADQKTRVEPENPSRREFAKKGAVALVLLPYVVPMIQSLTVNTAWAKRRGSPPPRNGSWSPNSPSSPKSQRIRTKKAGKKKSLFG